MSEESSNIPGYPGYSIDRSGILTLNGSIKHPRLGKDGYYVTNLKNPTSGINDSKRVKDLVALCYLPKDDPSKVCLGFKDRDNKNHHVDNLIWRTRKEHGIYSSSIPIDTSETRTCKVCAKTLPMTDFPFDHPDRETGVEGHRRHHCRSCISKARPPPTHEQKRKTLARWLKSKYDLSLEEYDALFASQDSKCAHTGCNVDISGKGHAHVDHCHATGKVRALLCPNCNRRLGLLGDNTVISEGDTAYLKKHDAVPRTVNMPVFGPRVTPPKTGDDHGNSGKVRSDTTKAAIAATKKQQAANRFEDLFKEKLECWLSDPTGDKQKTWRHSVSRKHREGTLPQSCIDILENTAGWTFSKGTPHTTDSRVQPRSTPAPAAPPGTP